MWCVIPVHNAGATVARVAAECRALVPNVVVVDDGSTDTDVTALFEGTGIPVLRHARNLGKGRAILTALAHVQARGGRWLVTLDADGQHYPRDLRRFLPLLGEQDDFVAIGTRDMSGPNVPGGSRFGRAFSDFWVRLETGAPAEDTQSGFRAYPVRHLAQVRFCTGRYDFEIEALVRLLWARLTVKAVQQADARVVEPRRFIRNLLREHSTPRELAASAGVGVFLATLPLVSFHTIAIVYVTTRLNLNRAMAVAIQNLCAPPFVPMLCIEVGYFMRHGRLLLELSREAWVEQIASRAWEWFLGSLVVAPALALLTAGWMYALVRALQSRAARLGQRPT